MTVVAEPTTRGTVIREVRTRAGDWIPAIVVFWMVSELPPRKSITTSAPAWLISTWTSS